MKKTQVALSIASALTALTLTTTAFNSMAADQLQRDDNTETIVVTANRSVQERFDVLAAVDVFTHADIEKIQAKSITDLLNHVAGINTITQGSEAHQSSVFVRGSNSDHVLVLIDGVRVGSATLGNKNFGDIPVQLIERIEVVRGSRAALWGSDAIGGVIQLFTRKLDNNEARLGAKIGSHNLWQTYGAIGLGNDNHQYTLSAVAAASDGFDVITPDPSNPYAIDQADDDGYDRQAVALTGSSKINDHYQINSSAKLTQGTTEIDASFGGDETHYKNHQLAIHNIISLGQFNLQINLANSRDFNEDNADKLFTGANKTYFETKRDQVSALAQVPLNNNGEIAAGIDWYNEQIASSNDYSALSRNALAIFASARQQIEQFKLEGSIRYDEVGDISGNTSYQLGLGYQLSEKLLMVLSQGTSFKAPTFNDLYWPEAFGSAGNPNLKPETANNVEFLSRYHVDNYSLELSLYKTKFDDLIEWAPLDVNDPFGGYQPSNVDKATVRGAEATVNTFLLGVEHALTLSHIEARNDNTGKQLAPRPYFTASYNLNYQLDKLNTNIEILYQGKRYDTNMAT